LCLSNNLPATTDIEEKSKMKRQASKGRGLLDDDDGEMQLTINEDFAKQYERKKKFEEVTQGASPDSQF
jgi:hypothetical protein